LFEEVVVCRVLNVLQRSVAVAVAERGTSDAAAASAVRRTVGAVAVVEGAVADAARVAAVVVTVAIGTGAEGAAADVAAGREAVSLSSGATDDSGSSDDSGKSESFEVHCFEVVVLVSVERVGFLSI
jgi:hypothetical protein